MDVPFVLASGCYNRCPYCNFLNVITDELTLWEKGGIAIPRSDVTTNDTALWIKQWI